MLLLLLEILQPPLQRCDTGGRTSSRRVNVSGARLAFFWCDNNRVTESWRNAFAFVWRVQLEKSPRMCRKGEGDEIECVCDIYELTKKVSWLYVVEEGKQAASHLRTAMLIIFWPKPVEKEDELQHEKLLDLFHFFMRNFQRLFKPLLQVAASTLMSSADTASFFFSLQNSDGKSKASLSIKQTIHKGV